MEPPFNRIATAVLGHNYHRYERRHGRGKDDNDDFGGWMLTFEGRADAAYLDVVGIQGAYTNRK